MIMINALLTSGQGTALGAATGGAGAIWEECFLGGALRLGGSRCNTDGRVTCFVRGMGRRWIARSGTQAGFLGVIYVHLDFFFANVKVRKFLF